MSFLPAGNAINSGDSEERVDYVQAADPETMERLVAQRIAAIVKENKVRVGEELPAFNVNDIRISGGGDGHTFVTRIYLSTRTAAVSWTGTDEPSQLSTATVKFWMAGTAEELEKKARAKLAELRAENDFGLFQIAADDAGASQGTRFMGFIGGAGPTQ
jgi:hypothetical protein